MSTIQDYYGEGRVNCPLAITIDTPFVPPVKHYPLLYSSNPAVNRTNEFIVFTSLPSKQFESHKTIEKMHSIVCRKLACGKESCQVGILQEKILFLFDNPQDTRACVALGGEVLHGYQKTVLKFFDQPPAESVYKLVVKMPFVERTLREWFEFVKIGCNAQIRDMLVRKDSTKAQSILQIHMFTKRGVSEMRARLWTMPGVQVKEELPGSKKKQLAKMANVQLPSKKGVAAPLTARTTTLSTITTHKDSTAHLTPFPVPEYNPSTATIMARRSSSSSIASSAGVSRMSSIGSLGSFGAGSVAGSVAGSGSGKGSAKQKYLNLGHSFAQPTASGSGAKGLSLGEQLGLGRRAEGDGEGNMADEEKAMTQAKLTKIHAWSASVAGDTVDPVAVALPPSPGPECPLFAYPTPTAPPHSSVVASAAPQVMSSNPGLYMVPAIELNPATNDNLAAMGEGSDIAMSDGDEESGKEPLPEGAFDAKKGNYWQLWQELTGSYDEGGGSALGSGEASMGVRHPRGGNVLRAPALAPQDEKVGGAVDMLRALGQIGKEMDY